MRSARQKLKNLRATQSSKPSCLIICRWTANPELRGKSHVYPCIIIFRPLPAIFVSCARFRLRSSKSVKHREKNATSDQNHRRAGGDRNRQRQRRDPAGSLILALRQQSTAVCQPGWALAEFTNRTPRSSLEIRHPGKYRHQRLLHTRRPDFYPPWHIAETE